MPRKSHSHLATVLRLGILDVSEDPDMCVLADATTREGPDPPVCGTLDTWFVSTTRDTGRPEQDRPPYRIAKMSCGPFHELAVPEGEFQQAPDLMTVVDAAL